MVCDFRPCPCRADSWAVPTHRCHLSITLLAPPVFSDVRKRLGLLSAAVLQTGSLPHAAHALLRLPRDRHEACFTCVPFSLAMFVACPGLLCVGQRMVLPLARRLDEQLFEGGWFQDVRRCVPILLSSLPLPGLVPGAVQRHHEVGDRDHSESSSFECTPRKHFIM